MISISDPPLRSAPFNQQAPARQRRSVFILLHWVYRIARGTLFLILRTRREPTAQGVAIMDSTYPEQACGIITPAQGGNQKPSTYL